MYICEECLETFSEPHFYEEQHPYGNSCASEGMSCCPYCKSNNYTDAKVCDRCGEYTTELKDGLCDVCYGDMYGEQEE